MDYMMAFNDLHAAQTVACVLADADHTAYVVLLDTRTTLFLIVTAARADEMEDGADGDRYKVAYTAPASPA